MGSSSKKIPHFNTLRPSEPQGMRDRANILVAHFGGEIISDKQLSIVKGAEAFKFKCINGHIFYKFVTELQQIKPMLIRKLSKKTAASSSSSFSSSDDETKSSLQAWQTEGCWCTKCESFFKSAQIVAKNNEFKLLGDIYSSNLILKCLKAKH